MFPLFTHPRDTLRWWAVLTSMSIVVGSASAFFIASLDAVTRLRFANPWLLFALPISGWVVAKIYLCYGKSSVGGNNLLIDEIHQPGAGVPARMAPLILFGTLATHLCGGSAGREGTALQMGGGIAAGIARFTRLPPHQIRLLLMAGIAAGFGSIFGTPIAGAVFALEVLVIGRLQYDALIPCFASAMIADLTCRAWGAPHTHYIVAAAPPLWLAPALIAKTCVAAILFGLVGSLFAKASHLASAWFQKWIRRAEVRPVVGGCAVIALAWICGTQDYLGLGVLGNHPDSITLPAFFHHETVPHIAWAWKLAFTVITLSCGFKGGEVTPLFFIGAALGHTLGHCMSAPTDLFAALGFVAIFAAATNTPIASALLGIELFGSQNAIYLTIACIVAYRFSTHQGIYSSQKLATPKFPLGPHS